MSDESTVLVVATDQLPEGLSAQLEKKGVFLERAQIDHLGPALVATAPDLLVFVGGEFAPRVLAAAEGNPVPVAVIAERAAHSELRQQFGARIAALIPLELPLAALSHRLITLARRASNGEALERPPPGLANPGLSPSAARAPGNERVPAGKQAAAVTKTAAATKTAAVTKTAPVTKTAAVTKTAGKSTSEKVSTRIGTPGRGGAPGRADPPSPVAAKVDRLPLDRDDEARTLPRRPKLEPAGRPSGPSPPAAASSGGRKLELGRTLGRAPPALAEERAAGPPAQEARKESALRQVGPSATSRGNPWALRGSLAPSPQPRLAQQTVEQEERISVADEDATDDLDSATAAFVLPPDVRELARQRSLPPKDKPESSSPRLKAPQPEQELSPEPPAREKPRARMAFDRTVLAEAPRDGGRAPVAENTRSAAGARSAAPDPSAQTLPPAPAPEPSRPFEAPVPPQLGTFAGDPGREASDRLSSGGRSAATSETELALPTPEQARRMQAAEALAARVRTTTASASAVRVVVCDDDFTRADAISRELREHGLDVMLLSPEYEKARWAVLRRYAPHGLLVDERSLSKGGRQIVGTFRRDPFLKYVPLVAIRFDRLFREEEATVNLVPLFPLLQPLGREELTLLDRLTLSGTLTVDLSQVLPNRLVELLGAHEHTCVLECHSAGQRLTWPISGGQAGKAELMEPASPGVSLRPEDALRWLLAQDEPQITVAARPQIRLTHPEAIAPLIERVTSAIDPPLEHSLVPPRGGGPLAAGIYARTLMGVAPAQPARLSGPAGMPTVPAPTDGHAAGSEERAPSRMVPDARVPHDAATLATGRTAAPQAGAPGRAGGVGGPGQLWRTALLRLGALEAQLVGFTLPLYRRACRGVATKREQWPPALFWAAIAGVALGVLLLVALLFSTCASSGEVEEGSVESGRQASVGDPSTPAAGAGLDSSAPRGALPAPARKGAGSSPRGPDQPADPSVIAKAQQADTGRFRVAADVAVKDCKDLVGNFQGSPRDASRYWKAARTKLVQGNTEAAHDLMCRSALIDPAAGAAEGLVGFYLNLRSLGLAENWAERVLATDPSRRSAKELLSDIRSQQGNPEQALTILLETLRLPASDTHKRSIVARKFLADARLAERSGDVPRAERLLRRAVILDPANLEAAEALAGVFLRSGLSEAASLWAEHILTIEPKHAGAHMVLGDIARLNKDYPAARQHYREVEPGSAAAGRAQGYLQDMPM